jgi:hypothetical protein
LNFKNTFLHRETHTWHIPSKINDKWVSLHLHRKETSIEFLLLLLHNNRHKSAQFHLIHLGHKEISLLLLTEVEFLKTKTTLVCKIDLKSLRATWIVSVTNMMRWCHYYHYLKQYQRSTTASRIWNSCPRNYKT